MENFEQKLNHVNAPEGSVESHRDALRKKLQNAPRGKRSRASVLTVALIMLVGATGLTIANPGWVKDIYMKVTTKEIRFTAEDGRQVHIVTKEVEAPEGTVEGQMLIEGDQPELSWNLDPKDPNAKKLLESGAAFEKTMRVDASVSGEAMKGRREMKLIVENENGNEIYILNGDTIKSMDELQAIKSHQGTVRQVMESMDEGSAETQSAPTVAANFELKQNYPNPFNPTTQISFELKEAGNVMLKVYDLTGREVARLVDGPQSAGTHTVTFDGSGLASGTYLFSLGVDGIQLSRTMSLVK